MFDIYVRGYTLPKLASAILLLVASIFTVYKLVQACIQESLFYALIAIINLSFFIYVFLKLQLLNVILHLNKYDKVWQLEQKVVREKEGEMIEQSPTLDLSDQKSESDKGEGKDDFEKVFQRYMQQNKKSNKNTNGRGQSEENSTVKNSLLNETNRFNKNNLTPKQRKTIFTRQTIQKARFILIRIFKQEKDAQLKNLQAIKQKVQEFLSITILEKAQYSPIFISEPTNKGLNGSSFSLFPLDQEPTQYVLIDQIISQFRQGNLWKCGYSINSYSRIKSNKQCVRDIEQTLQKRDLLDRVINFGALITTNEKRLERIQSLEKLINFYNSFSFSKLVDDIDDQDMKSVKKLQIFYLANHLNHMVESFDYRLKIQLKNELVKPIQQYQLLIQWVADKIQPLYYNQVTLVKYNQIQYLKQTCPKDRENTIHLFLSYLQVIKKMYGNEAFKINKGLQQYLLQLIKLEK